MSTYSFCSNDLMIFSGGAPYSMVDGDNVTICINNEVTTLQLTSSVKGMHVIDSNLTDMDSGIVGISSDVDVTSTGKFSFSVMLFLVTVYFQFSAVPLIPCLYSKALIFSSN